MTGGPAEHPIFAAPGDRMGHRAVRGVAATSVAQGFKLAVQFGSVVVLARLLTPSDFGIYAMVSPIIGFAMLFQDFGLSQAMIAQRDLTSTEAATMFRLNVGLAVAIAALLALLAVPIAHFYQQPQVAMITWMMSAQVVIAGCTVSHTALLSRAMRFRQLAVIEVVASLSGFAAALTVALNAPGPWAPAAQSIVAAAA